MLILMREEREGERWETLTQTLEIFRRDLWRRNREREEVGRRRRGRGGSLAPARVREAS